MTMQFRLVLLAFIVVLHVFGAAEEKIFESARERFSVRYASSWYFLDEHVEGLDIVNFPPDQRVGGVILPEQGARITVFRKPDSLPSLEKWIEMDLVDSRASSRREIDTRTGSSPCTKLVEVKWRWDAGGAPEVYAQETGYYCVTNAGIYRVSLSFWSDNHSEPELNSVALKMVRSLRVWSTKAKPAVR